MARRPTQRDLFLTLAERYGRDIAAAWDVAIAQARGGVDMAALAAAIDAREYERALDLLRIDQAQMFALTEAMRAAYVGGGVSVAQILPGAVGVFAFDGRHRRAEAWIAERAGTLVQAITDDTLPMLREVVRDGVERGQSGATVARSITGRMSAATGRREGGFLGLTTQQTTAAVRARAELAALDANYFTRELRDRRYDGLVRRAIADGKPLSEADIARITGRYRDRMLGYRGRMIARNEAHTALAAGQAEGMQQLIDSGRVQTVLKRWQWNRGGQKEPREEHMAMASMPAIPFDRPFTFPDGVQMQHPHDPAGGAKHSIGCRCTVFYRPVLPLD
jgi:hypothetical protein